jgi:hypothetical protein
MAIKNLIIVIIKVIIVEIMIIIIVMIENQTILKIMIIRNIILKILYIIDLNFIWNNFDLIKIKFL